MATANSGFTFVNWTESGSVVSTSASYTFTLNGDRTLVANFSPVNIAITVQANPSGRSFTVDGTTYDASQDFSWISGSTHAISTTSSQSGATGTQYVWSNWSDGGAISHTVAPTWQLTPQTSRPSLLTMPGARRNVSPQWLLHSGQSVNISATPTADLL
jgi:uncharacterized repeat protein (TIGR02543 family)